MSSKTKNSAAILIRTMCDGDIDSVASLEQAVFSDPWPLSSFKEIIHEQGWYALVAESHGVVIGYACYLVVANESHLANIAVDPGYRRKSVAKLLLANILEDVQRQQCEFMILEVRPSNTAAISFYESHGFKLLYRRPRYYRKPFEDALVMVKYFDEAKKD